QVHEAFWNSALPVNNSDVVFDEVTNLYRAGMQTSQALFDGAAVEPAIASFPSSRPGASADALNLGANPFQFQERYRFGAEFVSQSFQTEIKDDPIRTRSNGKASIEVANE